MKKFCLICLGVLALASYVPAADSTSAKQIVLNRAFTNSITLTQPQGATYPAITALTVTFPGGSQANVVTVSLVRAGVTHELMSYSYTGKTLTWYAPNNFYLLGGDQLIVTNSSGAAAFLICNEIL